MTAISLESLSLRLGEEDRRVQVLDDINLSVDAGEKVALVGPSGSGKTSLLTLIAGLQPPTSGTVSILGKRVDQLSEDDLSRMRGDSIGIVFQSFHLIPTMTALENVCVPMELAGRTNVRDDAAKALDSVGLTPRISHYPHQMSGGEQQRVAIARAFTNRPSILLADEPTGNLDEETGAMVVTTLMKMVDDSKASLVFITHDASLLAKFDRVVRIRGGKLVNGAGD